MIKLLNYVLLLDIVWFCELFLFKVLAHHG